MRIRQETKADFAAIYDLIKTAFQTANVSNGDEQNFANRLRTGGNYLPELALVAENKGELAGHIMLTKTFVETAHGPFPLLLLAPLSVVLEHRRQGIGSALVREAFRCARAAGHSAAVVVGDPAYYGRFGFRCAQDFGISNTNGIPDPYVMACELVPGALQEAKGTVSFDV